MGSTVAIWDELNYTENCIPVQITDKGTSMALLHLDTKYNDYTNNASCNWYNL